MPIKIKIYNTKADATGERDLSEKVFGVKLNAGLVHQAATTQMDNERQVLAHTKGRSDVRGGGRKPWKQKGTGRARAGTRRSPLWIGGGVVFGPTKDRNFSKKINIKMKQKALCMVLSDKVANEAFAVVDALAMDGFKTKEMDKVLTAIEKAAYGNGKTGKAGEKKSRRNILVIQDGNDEKVVKSGRNLAGVTMLSLDNINILDILSHKRLLITNKAVDVLEERYDAKQVTSKTSNK